MSEHNYGFQEIENLRTYNSKTFRTSKTKEVISFGLYETGRSYKGEFVEEFHVKPIHYVALDGSWHDLSEIASYFGNKRGMILKNGYEEKVDWNYLIWYLKRLKTMGNYGILLPTRIPLLVCVTLTAYPDPNPETSTVDGFGRRTTVNEIWGTIRGAAGNASDESGTDIYATIFTSATSGQYSDFSRGITL